MKLLTATVENFASYKSLTFNFDSQGLALVSGPTGSGKSTLCDIVPWILFGRTSKGGNVDEVRAWGTDAPTYGTILMEFKGESIAVCRIRGARNDLYYIRECVWEHPIRGKDIQDTQKIINNLLGADAELFLAGSYFHEFSQTAQFFTASAKNRRALTEQLVNLELAKTLALNMTDYKKEIKKEVQTLVDKSKLKANDLLNKTSTLEAEETRADEWHSRQIKIREQESERASNFDITKQIAIGKIHEDYEVASAELRYEQQQLMASMLTDAHFQANRKFLDRREAELPDETCSECGTKRDGHKRLLITKERYALKNKESENNNRIMRLKVIKRSFETLERRFVADIETEERRENLHLRNLNKATTEINPYYSSIMQLNTAIEHIEKDILSIENELREMNVDLSDLDFLTDITNEFRQVLVKSTIRELEQSTNKLLNDHFDAEIKVAFEMEDADKLEVAIIKDVNQCTYTQLSKGQRQLLKLCFGVSVMRAVANHHGIRFSNVWMDECLDGADDITKAKGFRLLETLSLEYDSVLVVEHSEPIKSMFNKRYDVALINGHSEITTDE